MSTSAERLLTRRQEQIVALAAQALTNKAIAKKLCISEATVKVHLHLAFEKLGIKSRSTLVRLYAFCAEEQA
jgi:DNA-binding NarL/FixJ family response regulator